MFTLTANATTETNSNHSHLLVSSESSNSNSTVPGGVKNSWITRKLKALDSTFHITQSNNVPRIGDCVLTRVIKVGNHSRVFTEDNEYSTLYPGDCLVGVLGTRYATDAYHAMRIDPGALHMLTNGGLLGTVCDQHSSMKVPTKLELMGYLVDDLGTRTNIKNIFFEPASSFPSDVNPVFIVGTGMNSGKTTSTARLGNALVRSGKSVAILKLTGSASHRDIHEFKATGAVFTADFSDYGFPSTYLTSQEEMESLYQRMMNDVAFYKPDVVLIEIADGVYQRETQFLLNSELLRSSASGVVLTAACAASALSIDHAVRQFGWDPIAVTGLITNAPLFVQEFGARCKTPVCDTKGGILEICERIVNRVQSRKPTTISFN